MWWVQMIQAVLQAGMAKAQQDAEENRAEQFAKMARGEGAAQAALDWEEGARVRGRAATLAAAGGGGLTGSALDVLDDLGRQAKFKVRSTLYSAETDARFGTRVSSLGAMGAGIAATSPLLSEWAGSRAAQRQGGGGVGSGLGGAMGGMGG
ncbi:MAG TPA: hypothetical protein VEA44_16205 [Caulobacter sp.]|nr:hypothetical protein [Caulobacter sp.]